MIHLRPAGIEDSDMLLRWRNDPDTCANSRSTAPVSQSDHDRWMKYSVTQGYPQHLVFIGEADEVGSVGVMRFDASPRDLMTYEASITVAPKYRGHGFAQQLLASGCSAMPEYAITADVRSSNKASNLIFQRCGFSKVGQREGFVNYRREPLA